MIIDFCYTFACVTKTVREWLMIHSPKGLKSKTTDLFTKEIPLFHIKANFKWTGSSLHNNVLMWNSLFKAFISNWTLIPSVCVEVVFPNFPEIARIKIHNVSTKEECLLTKWAKQTIWQDKHAQHRQPTSQPPFKTYT